MRTKIALLVGVMALAVASIAPAAQGKVVTLDYGGEFPLETGYEIQAHSPNLGIYTGWGPVACTWGNAWSQTPKAGNIITEVVKNQADPAVLNGFSGVVPCSLNGNPPLSGSSEATGPIELYGDGTGKLPIKFSIVYSDPKNPCVYTAVLGLIPQAGQNTAKFYGSGWAPGCGPAEFKGDLTFNTLDGVPVYFFYS